MNYNYKDLKKSLDAMDSLLHKAKMQENEYRKLVKFLESEEKIRQSKLSNKIVMGSENLIGRKVIKTVTVGTWDNSYILFECEDGQRVCVSGNGRSTYRLPSLNPEDMKISKMYTDDEIQNKINYIESCNKQREEDIIKQKKEKFERLKNELETI